MLLKMKLESSFKLYPKYLVLEEISSRSESGIQESRTTQWLPCVMPLSDTLHINKVLTHFYGTL